MTKKEIKKNNMAAQSLKEDELDPVAGGKIEKVVKEEFYVTIYDKDGESITAKFDTKSKAKSWENAMTKIGYSSKPR